jgi:hypothetical protein
MPEKENFPKNQPGFRAENRRIFRLQPVFLRLQGPFFSRKPILSSQNPRNIRLKSAVPPARAGEIFPFSGA